MSNDFKALSRMGGLFHLDPVLEVRTDPLFDLELSLIHIYRGRGGGSPPPFLCCRAGKKNPPVEPEGK